MGAEGKQPSKRTDLDGHMTVSCVTLSLFPSVWPENIRAGSVLSTAMLCAMLTACNSGARPPRATLTTLPLESISLRFPTLGGDTRALVRHSMFNDGIQVDAENRKAGWMRADLGGQWVDRLRYKQWFLVATYYPDSATASTVVVLRALEQSHSYLVGETTRAGPQVISSSGVDRVGLVSDVSQGQARNVWNKLEQLATTLAQRGAVRITPVR